MDAGVQDRERDGWKSIPRSEIEQPPPSVEYWNRRDRLEKVPLEDRIEIAKPGQIHPPAPLAKETEVGRQSIGLDVGENTADLSRVGHQSSAKFGYLALTSRLDSGYHTAHLTTSRGST